VIVAAGESKGKSAFDTNPAGATLEWYTPESDGLWSSSRKFKRDWWKEDLGRRPLCRESAVKSGSRRDDAWGWESEKEE